MTDTKKRSLKDELQEAAIEYGTLFYQSADGERKSAGPNPHKIEGFLVGARAGIQSLIQRAREMSVEVICSTGLRENKAIRLSDLEKLSKEVQ